MAINDYNPAKCIYNGHEYVDLGLSVKWATCNIGAESSHDPGGYFSWGEVEEKEYYDTYHYKWYCKIDNYPYWKVLKYCSIKEDSYGFFKRIDNKTVLDPEDDAAHVLWGGTWRIPSTKEWLELINNCTWEWRFNGKYRRDPLDGYCVTSKIPGYTDRHLFLPAAGFIPYRFIKGDPFCIYEENKGGQYWANSKPSDRSTCAHVCSISKGTVWSSDKHYMVDLNTIATTPHYGTRTEGCSIRPVCI